MSPSAHNLSMRILNVFLLSICCFLGLVSCADRDEPEMLISHPVNRTVIMFFPWSSNLLTYFQQNIQDFSKTIEENGLTNERVFVCLASSPNSATLMELTNTSKGCVTHALREYHTAFTTSESISQMLADICSLSPAERYGMIIGCHGMSWLPVKPSPKAAKPLRLHYTVQTGLLTRYFGGLTEDTQIEIGTLAQAIENAGLHMEYILFDDCYMASAEVAYELRNVTDYLIASPTEILAYGFPYHLCGKHLLGNVDYQGIIDEFYSFYSTYRYPYGTAAVIDCSEMENLAAIVRNINRNAPNAVHPSNLQPMDGYTPTLFFDFGDYFSRLCSDPMVKEELSAQLDRIVPFKCHTPKFYTSLKGEVPISTFSGITTSQPSIHSLAAPITETSWLQATQ